MEFDPQDQDIIRLLSKLKEVDGKYPENMFIARRRSFLKRMTEIELGISGDTEIKNKIENTKPPTISPATSTLLEIALIVAIVVEASTMAYFYRAKLADFFRAFTTASRVEEVTPPPAVPTLLEVPTFSPSQAITSTALAGSPAGITATPTSTLMPATVDSTPAVNQLNSTSVPNGNNGNHYGQTPKPERTKENNGNNDKPPKDDKPPKEKSTKTK